MHKKWKHLSEYSIKQQLFIIYLPIIFLSTLVIGGVFIADSTKKMLQSYENLALADSLRVRSIIFEATTTLKNIATSMATDSELRTLLSTDFSSPSEANAAINSYAYIDRIEKQETAVKSITIYTTNQSISNYKNFSYLSDSLSKENWTIQGLAQPEEFWQTNRLDNGDFHLLTLYKNIPLPLSNKSAILEIRLDYNFLRNRIKNTAYQVQVALNNDPLFYSNNISQIGQNSLFTSPETLVGENVQLLDTKEQKNLLVSTTALPLGNDSDTIRMYSIDNTAYSILKSNVLKWISILLLVLFSTFLLVLFFTTSFSKRVKQLQDAVYHAASDDYEFFSNISGDDEISKISLDFHKIIQKIKQNEEEIFQSKLHEQELLNQQQQMEFNLLASQINPHFLFNTLETIRMTALKNKDRDVAESIKLLSKSIRYTLDTEGKKITTLEKELAAIDVYAHIQKMRFGDRVNINYQLSPNIDPKQIKLLPLLIQPLIENAITHGLEGLTRYGMITLSILNDTNGLRITVHDNGVGIEKNRLLQLRNQIEHMDLHNTKNIGLKNVNNRIKMYYGPGSGIQITSEVGKGTNVTILLRKRQVITA